MELRRLERLEVEWLPVGSLKPNSYNPNRQSEGEFELLLRSMSSDGFTQPIVALRGTMEIVDGEHRWRASRVLGYERVPVVLVDMSAEQARVSTLRHNRARGGEDARLAAAVLRDLDRLGLGGWARDGLGMDEVEWESFVGGLDEADGFTMGEAEAIAGGSDEVLREYLGREGVEVGEGVEVSVSDVVRAREERIERERGEEERSGRAVDEGVYRLRLVFTGEEGRVVKRVLGSRPVERLLELAREGTGHGS